MKSRLIALAFLFGTLEAAEELQLNEDIVLVSNNVYTVSVFDELTYFTAYSLDGEPIWEAPFNSNVLSWKVKDGQLFVFSVARNKAAYFLTCVDAHEGTLVWERVIKAPSAP